MGGRSEGGAEEGEDGDGGVVDDVGEAELETAEGGGDVEKGDLHAG